MLAGFRLGVTPSADDGESDRLRAFVAALEDVLHRRVEVYEATDYRVLLASVEQGMVQLAWLPPIAAARGVASGAVVPVAVGLRNGSTSYMAGLITKAQSPLKSLADLRGVRAAWVDRESASGYVVIRAALRQAGIRLTEAFSEELFLRSHPEVVRAVHEGRADVGATYVQGDGPGAELYADHVRHRFGSEVVDFRILAKAGPIPSEMFGLHRAVADVLLAPMQSGIVDARPMRLHQTALDLMQCDGFVRPMPEHVAMLAELLATVDARSTLPPPRSTLPPPR